MQILKSKGKKLNSPWTVLSKIFLSCVNAIYIICWLKHTFVLTDCFKYEFGNFDALSLVSQNGYFTMYSILAPPLTSHGHFLCWKYKRGYTYLYRWFTNLSSLYMISDSYIYKKHIDASVKERPQTLIVPSEEICKRVLCNKHI